MKRLVAALTGLTMLAFCVGCGSDNSSSSGTESGAAKDGKEITIGYSQLDRNGEQHKQNLLNKQQKMQE